MVLEERACATMSRTCKELNARGSSSTTGRTPKASLHHMCQHHAHLLQAQTRKLRCKGPQHASQSLHEVLMEAACV